MRDPIRTAQAAITTASVELRVITINGKQMTLAVFRQLPWVHLLDDMHQIRPDIEVWGYVEYCQPHCCQGTHRHVVFVDRGRLCCCILEANSRIVGRRNLFVKPDRVEYDTPEDADRVANHEIAWLTVNRLPQLYIAV